MTKRAWFLFFIVFAFTLLPVLAQKKPKMVKTVVTFTSVPGGAVLSTPSGNSGKLPLEVEFQVPDKECKIFQGITVRWVSGAEKKVDDLSVCAKKNRTYAVLRPSGGDIDADLKLDAQLREEDQRERDREQRAAQVEESRRQSQTANRGIEFRPIRIPEEHRIDCTSTANGNTVDTKCREK